MSDTEKKKRGRPVTKSNLFDHPLAHALLKELAQRKATNEECATRMQCSLNTWKRWKTKNADLWASMGAKLILDDESVELALLESARGFTKLVTKVEDGVTTIEERYYPPNVAATAFYLKNRKPNQWRDKIDIAASMEQIPVRINFKRKEKIVSAESSTIPERKELVDSMTKDDSDNTLLENTDDQQ
jgi:hypothetical protein